MIAGRLVGLGLVNIAGLVAVVILVVVLGEMFVVMRCLVVFPGTHFISGVCFGSVFVEMVVTIAVVDYEGQGLVSYDYRFVEVLGLEEQSVLPAGKYIAEFICAAVPIDSEEVGGTNQTIEVVEIDFIDGFILIVGELKLVSHLVGEEERFAACLCIAHSVSIHHSRDHQRGNE